MRKNAKNLWKTAVPVIGTLCLLSAIPALAADAAADTDEAAAPVTFMEGDFYGEVIEDEYDALDAIMSVIDQLGGDENIVLNPLDTILNVDDMSVYSFRQVEGETAVQGATVKLITDKDSHVCALSSSLIPGIDAEPLDEWGISAEEAEEIVLEFAGERNLRVVEDSTQQVLLPYADDDEQFYYAWVVYTNNDDTEYDVAYLAHYVDEQGEYLYNMPVIQPSDTDSLSGEGASLIFLPYEEATWSGTVTKHDGTTKELEVPVLKDKETGELYLGDLERKILCIDYADFEFNDKITIRKAEDGRFADNELLIYDTFLNTYKLYDTGGWTGPDGEGTPVLLQMDLVYPNGEPELNAAYSGKKHGYQTFEFNRVEPDGECTDIIGHEFTHCLTGTLMTQNLYYNEYGAINEAFSDICGNIIEAALEATDDTTWMIQENGLNALRSMSDPHAFEQPAFVWDMYYMPRVDSLSGSNDRGGVHINSSLLNLIGYRLNQTGMDPVDQLYFWMNVALVMTPRTDYDDLIKILPWCANMLGFSEYVPALEAAFEETGIGDLSLPETVPEGFGRIQFFLPPPEEDVLFPVKAEFLNLDDGNSYSTSPQINDYLVAATLPAGSYMSILTFYNEDDEALAMAVLGDDGWVIVSEEDLMQMIDTGEGLGGFAVRELESGDISEVDTSWQEALVAQLDL